MLIPKQRYYTAIHFRDWRDEGILNVSPKFQRRKVWSKPARSYLIDTLLLGMPVPPIYLRVVQAPSRDQVIHEVIDGQQRISAVLDYIDDAYPLSRNIETEWQGRRFSQLPPEQQEQILQYSFTCSVFYGIEDPDVLGIFARMNTFSVRLNAQELRNGRFFGPFKQTAYKVAYEHLEFWRQSRVFTELRIARMAEVELTSELLILQLDGLQDKKKSIDSFYKAYDATFPARRRVVQGFNRTISEITASVGEILAASEFRRPPLFYSLFGVVHHRIVGVPKLDLERSDMSRLSAEDRDNLEAAVCKLSELIVLARKDKPVPKNYSSFVAACLRQTDNIRPRLTRLRTLYRQAFTA